MDDSIVFWRSGKQLQSDTTAVGSVFSYETPKTTSRGMDMKSFMSLQNSSGRVAAAIATLAMASLVPSRQAEAANWTATASANWATGAGGGWNGGTTGANTIRNTPGQALALVSTTATLVSDTTTGALGIARLNYAFTVDGGSGFKLTGLQNPIILQSARSSNADATNLESANRVDFTFNNGLVLAGVVTFANGGDAGRLRLMGDISESGGSQRAEFYGNITIGGSNTFTGQVNVGAGSVVLDYGADGGKNASKFGDSAAVIMEGNSRFTLAGGSHEEIVGSTTVRRGMMYLNRSSGSSTLRLNAITFNTDAAIDFGANSLASTDTNNTNGILSGRATVGGTTWATSLASSAADTPITGLTTYATNVFASGSNTDITSDASPSASFTTNSLRFNAAGSRTVTLAGNNTLQSGGLLVTRNVGSGTTLITGGTLAPSAVLAVHQHNTAGVLNIASNINMANGLLKTGSGTLRLSNSTDNSGAGAVNIYEGTVAIATSVNVLGTGAIQFAGGTIANVSAGSIVIPNAITLGPNVGNGWVSRVGFSGTSPIVLGGAMNVSAGASTNVARNVIVDVASGLQVSATNSTAWGLAYTTFTKVGSGTFSVQGSNFTTNTQGPLVVREGTMDFSRNGTMTSGMAVLYGGVLQFDNTTTNVNGRTTSGASGFQLAGGEMKLIGNATVATSQTTSSGPTFLQSGASTITVQSQGQPTTLTVGTRIGSWNQTTATDGLIGSTVLVRGTQLGSGSTGSVGRLVGNTTTTGAPNGYPAAGSNGVGTSAASIVPWMLADNSETGSGKTFAMYDYESVGGNGFRPLNLSTEVLTSDSNTIGNYYFSGSGTTTAANARTWRSLQLDGGRTLAATSGTSSITMNAGSSAGTAGAILSTGASNTIESSIRLDAGNSNIYFHTVTDLAVKGAVTNGSGAFVKSSAGTLTLSGTSNRSTGNTYVNQGVLKISSSNALYDMSTFAGTAQQQRVITVWGRPGSDAGVLELNGVNWTTGTSTTPGIVLQDNNATLRGTGTSSYGNGGAAYLSAYGDVFLEASGADSVLTLNSPISRDSGLATSINVKGAGQVVLGAGAGNSTLGTSRGNAEMDWYIGGSRNGNLGSLAVNASGTVGVSSNTFYVASGGILSGTGTIGSAVSVQTGVIAPGNSAIGTLSVSNDVTWDAGGNWLFQLGTPAATLATSGTGSTADLLSMTGAFTQGTGSTFTFDFATSGSDGWYRLVKYGSTTFASGTNTSFAAANLPTGKTANFVVDNATSALYVQIVPEPGTLALLGVAGVGFLVRRMRRRAA